MSSIAVNVRSLRVRRGWEARAAGLSLEIPAGAVTGLFGPSGCGKTTLLRAIVGVQRVDGGEVSVLGEPAGTALQRRRVAYVTQAPSVYGDLTVRENLRYFARLLGVGGERIGAVAESVGLTPEPRARRLALRREQSARRSRSRCSARRSCSCSTSRPSASTPVLRRDLWRLFHELAAAGATLLVSSHVMDEAERCDHLVFMREGA